MDDPRGRRNRGRLALPGVGAGAGWLGRLDIPPPSPPLECAVFVRRNYLVVRLSAARVEGLAGLLAVVVSIWQGILLWKGDAEKKNASKINTS